MSHAVSMQAVVYAESGYLGLAMVRGIGDEAVYNALVFCDEATLDGKVYGHAHVNLVFCEPLGHEAAHY